MRAIARFALFALSWQLVGCSPQSAVYTEQDVQQFVVPGTTREAVVGRFGRPGWVQKNPKFEDGSTNVDEILIFFLPTPSPPRNRKWEFSGFKVRLKAGKAVDWTAVHSDTHVAP